MRDALEKFNAESHGLVFVADDIREAGSGVVVVGRVQEWGRGDLSRELPVTLLWEFDADDLVRIREFASAEAALAAVQYRHARRQ